ncbi:MAG TPA: VOC family protein [Propionibacteriaceae bacterium]
MEGEFLDTVIGIPDSRPEIVMLRPPDGGTRLELSSFVRPDHEPGSPAAMANELGLRNVAFEVDDLQAAVDRLAADGYGPRRPALGWTGGPREGLPDRTHLLAQRSHACDLHPRGRIIRCLDQDATLCRAASSSRLRKLQYVACETLQSHGSCPYGDR